MSKKDILTKAEREYWQSQPFEWKVNVCLLAENEENFIHRVKLLFPSAQK